jgi:NADH:ubiquinone oxidoreductase subunit 6 (subunit J)
MIGWIFAGITLSAVVMATFAANMRQAVLALWVAGLGVGAMYLTVGSEFLAIVQWIISTLVTLSFVFFAVMFGEYNAPKARHSGINILLTSLSVALGFCFAAVVWLGSKDLPDNFHVPPTGGNDLEVVGRTLTQNNLLSLEVLALTLFLVLVGGGVIARSEGGDTK